MSIDLINIKIRKAFLALADQYPMRLRVIDASQSKEEILQSTLEAISGLL